ncbi:MAG: OmpA family protein [Gammaproteobacteria bacterium]|nr:OmpA family protein [Gammaproteobacteria bacterium]MDJ0873358.1 OmpA family protein [Gammaproteobacteria bacterium]MDJ0892903.1 OmpA family protein [Gammaproteobacteria bacterium]
MNKTITLGTALLGLLLAGAASAQDFDYYLATPRGVAVNSFGECWRSTFWTTENAVQKCDPQPVVETAAVETTTVLSKREVNLSAETLFGFDQAELSMEGMKTLDGVAASAAEVPNQTIRITGHTDRIGSLEHNKQLSVRRAQAVQDYLASKGLSTSNMEIDGVGPAEPLVTCEGKGGQELIQCLGPNRRTEIEFAGVEVMEESGVEMMQEK